MESAGIEVSKGDSGSRGGGGAKERGHWESPWGGGGRKKNTAQSSGKGDTWTPGNGLKKGKGLRK